MSSKKQLRRKRREQEQEGRRSRTNPAWIFILAIALSLAVLVGGYVLFSDRSGLGDPPWPGAVWSDDHGHWH